MLFEPSLGGRRLLSGFSEGSPPPLSLFALQASFPVAVGLTLQCLTTVGGFALTSPKTQGANSRLPAAAEKAMVRKYAEVFMLSSVPTDLYLTDGSGGGAWSVASAPAA
jgi:hypothetical protein